ncbi:hypothetical protein QTI33_09645 [Variovorax sp. J22P271]|uniref:hypothetical protein n=1 Tax=Variovorax davisae TaxID=3053515 RepID=UPI002578D1A5|nr:hypothetical protein [Variovorax sp. J22P271]MDM0032387.1 hypothetical protein [Variovorax sp. J22P271]
MHTDVLSTAHRRYLRTELLLGCVFNAVLSVMFAFVALQGRAAMPLWGVDGMAIDLIPTVFMITLVGNLIVTLLTRKRVRDGRVPPLEPTDGPGARLPRNALLRVLVLALLMTIVLVPLSTAVLAALGLHSMPSSPFIAYKLIYGMAVGALSAPLVIRAALADHAAQPPQHPPGASAA